MTASTGPDSRHHIFLTVHASPVLSIGNWANIVEHVKQILIHLPNANWPAMQAYGPTNERFGPGSFCVEMTIDGPTYRELHGKLLELPDWFTVPVHVWEVAR